MDPSVRRCAWCRQALVEAKGVYLELLANGRRMCSGCGRFEDHCACLTIASVLNAAKKHD